LKQQRQIYTVSEITQDIKLLLENAFGEVWVEGEVSNFRPSQAGHWYFSLKDDSALLSAAVFIRNTRDIRFKLEDGLKVVCFGKIDIYAPRGQYQLIIEKIEPKGIGGLQLALEQLKEKLEKEGLFKQEHKRPIPYLPGCIGVITSQQGAAIKDILKVLDRRFKEARIVIRPVRVQGEGAKEDISEAIKELNLFNESVDRDKRIEVMIVGRGGGSIEDLWAFNEEVVARAIYNSRIPVISAVGHERDVTLSDLVADVRAPTPSAAAELVIPRKEDLKNNLEDLTGGLQNAFANISAGFQQEINGLLHRLHLNIAHDFELAESSFQSARRKLFLLNPAVRIQQYLERALDLARQIFVRAGHIIELKQNRFHKAAGMLSGLSPLNILSRGYSITFAQDSGRIIKEGRQLAIGDSIKTRLYKGELISEVRGIK